MEIEPKKEESIYHAALAKSAVERSTINDISWSHDFGQSRDIRLQLPPPFQ